MACWPVSSRQLADARRYFIVLALVLAAAASEPAMIAQLSLALPLCLLYEGLVLALRMAESTSPPRH